MGGLRDVGVGKVRVCVTPVPEPGHDETEAHIAACRETYGESQSGLRSVERLPAATRFELGRSGHVPGES